MVVQHGILRARDDERWADKSPKAEVAYNYIQCQDRKN